MICNNCGQQIEDDSKFCTFCGEKLLDKIAKEEETEDKMIINDNIVTVSSDKKPEKTKHISKIIIGIIVAIATCSILMAIGIIAVIYGNIKSNTANRLVYIKDNELFYIKDITKDETEISIYKYKNKDVVPNIYTVEFDEKYLYFFSKYNDEEIYGTLCRVPLSIINKRSKNIDRYIEEIDTKVGLEYGYVLIENNGVVYKKQNGTLVYYNGKEVIDIKKNIDYFWISDNGEYVFYGKREDFYFYGLLSYYNIKEGTNNKVDSNVHDIISYDTDCFIYEKYKDDDEVYDIYKVVFPGESEKISKNVKNYAYDKENKYLYVVEEVTKKYKAYDFVNDTYADKDINNTEPNLRDYLTEIVNVEEVLDEYDYNYYFNLYPEDIEYFYNDLDYDGEVDMYCYENKNTGVEYLYDENSDTWYKIDVSQYEDEYGKYDMLNDRVALREELKQTDIENSTYNLLLYRQDEDVIVISEDIDVNNIVLGSMKSLPIIFYNKVLEDSNDKIDIDDILYNYDVSDIIWLVQERDFECDTEIYYSIKGSSEKQLGINGYIWSVQGNNNISLVTSDEDDGDIGILLYEVKNNELVYKDSINKDDMGTEIFWQGDTLYYYTDIDDYSGELYKYESGKSTKIGGDIYWAEIFENNSIVACCDYASNYTGDIKIYDSKCRENKIVSEEDQYEYIKENLILYMSDGDLYIYTGEGKEPKKRIITDVDEFKCENAIHGYMLQSVDYHANYY